VIEQKKVRLEAPVVNAGIAVFGFAGAAVVIYVLFGTPNYSVTDSILNYAKTGKSARTTPWIIAATRKRKKRRIERYDLVNSKL
jgi:hypothetical protein